MLEKALNTVMPFKIIRFGNKNRKGRYTLSHKNSFLVRVQLLDNTIMECTLTVENTGIDCLNAVANRLELKEVQYFGLQYYNKQMAIRWVELDKPLKKQVDKNAQDPTLFFRVMYYVANFELLQQEITRYLFYLQLKNNVIDGCLPRSPEEAIELASYMLQAEFGDYNPEVHTVQYFRDFILFPEVMAPNEEILDSLTRETLNFHQKHRGLTPPDAEFNYILKVIHLEGYGEECYLAKDSQNCDFEIGCSFVGIVAREILAATESQSNTNEKSSVSKHSFGKVTWYEWNSIDSVLFTKATIILNMRKDDTTLQFHMEDAETAKYVCRIFETRRKFYSLNRQSSKKLAVENGESSIQRRPTLRRTQDTPMPIAEVVNSQGAIDQHTADGAQLQHPDFISSQENLQSYGRPTDAQYYASQTSLDHVYVSQTSLNRVPGVQQEFGYANGYVPSGSMYSSPSINSLGHSQTQLNQRSPASSNISLSSERHLAGNGVPVYRRTPEYDQAVQQRRRYSSYLENQVVSMRQKQPDVTELHDVSLKPRPHSMIYSQQELLQQAIHGPHYAHYPLQNPPLHYLHGAARRVDSANHLPTSQTQIHRPVESSHESLHAIHGLATQPSQHPTQYPIDRHPQHVKDRHLQNVGGIPGNAILAASTPELANSIQQVQGYSGSEMQLLRHYNKPPPPYPRNNSTSTPDLSAHRNTGVSASTPDLHHGYSVAPGQRRGHLHPIVAEDGRYDSLQEHQELDEFGPTVIRGVCTSVEALHRPPMAVLPQRPQAALQSVHAYIQEVSNDKPGIPESGQRPRVRHTGHHPNPRHHRPVSYPPRLNHSNQILAGVEENFHRLPTVQQTHTPLERSQTNSSTSTVDTPYGSLQYIPEQQGSQISLQHAQLTPAAHPVLSQYHPTPQRAEVHITGMTGNLQYQQNNMPVQDFEDDDSEQDHEDRLQSHQITAHHYHPAPQHAPMASNVTMVVHSSASENENDSDESSVEGEPKADYRNAPLMTIDHWHRERPKEMYVPPKNDSIQFPASSSSQAFRPPPPYPDSHEAENEDDSIIPKIPAIETSDHDPPKSYRKPEQMQSFDEGDMAQLSVFPHPNPSPMPHSHKLSNTNPFYSSNPFYIPHERTQNPDHGNMPGIFDFQQSNVGSGQQDNDVESVFANAPSGELRNARRSTRRNSPLKVSGANFDIDEPSSPSTGSPDDRVLQLEKVVEEGVVFTEFKSIPSGKASSNAEPFMKDPSGLRDRKGVYPYHENRVIISRTAANPEGYINASFMKIDVAGEEQKYILCQNPKESFLHEFWEMVWDQGVRIITMISKDLEDGKGRCGRYWPEHIGDSDALLFGDYRISSENISEISQTTFMQHADSEAAMRSRISSSTCKHLSTSILALQKAGTTERRKIWHLHYYGWPDSGAPKEATDFLAFLEELESVRRLAQDIFPQQPPAPVLVHCPSGAGRSGVFVLCDLMRHSLEHNKTTTIPEMLKALRQQRANVVQTVSQYHFVYQVLILFLKNSRLI